MTILLTLLPFILITTFTPGPNNILVMSQAINYGFTSTIRYQIGAFISNFVLVYIVFCFGSMMEKMIPNILLVVKYIGVFYLIYLSVHLMTAKAPNMKNKAQGIAFHDGIIVQFINPKVYLTAFTSAAIILPAYQNYAVLAIFGICISAISILAMITWASMGTMLQSFLRKWYRQTNVFMGFALLWCAYSISIS